MAFLEMLGEKRDSFAVLGALAALYITLKTTCALWSGVKQFLLAKSLGVNLKSLGSWAVVTGSTDGIGKAYAEALAKLGLNIVLISRTPEKLRAVATEIESKYKVQTKVIAVDFTAGVEIYSRIAAELSGLDVGVLVNNVGMSYDFPVYLHEASDEDVKNIINVNCNSVAFMCKIVLPIMLEKRKGAILNVSSLSGIRKVPFLSIYSATKNILQVISRPPEKGRLIKFIDALKIKQIQKFTTRLTSYVTMLSECLAGEYGPKGIHVQCVAPGFVTTKLSKIRHSSILVPNPESYVRSALPTVGVTQRTYGYFSHAAQMAVTNMLPDWLYLYLSNKLMLGARSKGLKKKNSKAE